MWRHGTTYGYKIKKCRCELCRRANTREVFMTRHRTGATKKYQVKRWLIVGHRASDGVPVVLVRDLS